jgi:hypothetical protein
MKNLPRLMLWAVAWLTAIGRLEANENGTDLVDLEEENYTNLDESRCVL